MGEIRILSIQSHVVRGYVGNRAAVFPLQLLGFHVDVINSVQFASTHVHQGQTLCDSDLRTLFNGILKAEKIQKGIHSGTSLSPVGGPVSVSYSYLLSGYVGEASFLKEIVNFVAEQKRLVVSAEGDNSNNLVWVCDPVMGDNGNLYVPKSLVDVYREFVLPVADIITPNHYELQWLCGVEQVEHRCKLPNVLKFCEKLVENGPRVVVVTSVPLCPDEGEEENDMFALVAAERIDNHAPNGYHDDVPNEICEVPNSGEKRVARTYRSFTINFPRRTVYLAGTGDLMAAMLLAGLARFNNDLQRACESALTIVQNVMAFTLENCGDWEEVNLIGAQHCIKHNDADKV